MFSKDTIKSLINKSKSIDSVSIPKQLTPMEKSKVIDDFTKKFKTNINGREVVLVAIQL
jgi:hypothetical protein